MIKLNWYIKHHHHNYYSLVEPYRENSKNRHRQIYYFGRLTQEELQIINHSLDVLKSQESKTIKVEDIIFDSHLRYLDVAFLNTIWEQWKLPEIFPRSEDKDVQTSDIAKILTIYRCLDPGSYLSSIEWFKKTALGLILDIKDQHINKTRIFRELDEIENRKKNIEYHLYKTLKEGDQNSSRIVFYDLTDSYFEGKNCELASPGRTKSNGFRKKRIVLSLLVNSKGYPFAWNILEDYNTDVETIKNLSVQWKNQFKFGDSEIILVFDRGMVSNDNLKHLEKIRYKYITALDKNQIPRIKNIDIESFDLLSKENMIEQITKMGFTKYDETTYYKNIGFVDGRRFVLIFNPQMFVDERRFREEQILRAKEYLEGENKNLSRAEKSRSESTMRGKVETELKRMKVWKFLDFSLEPLVIKAEGRDIHSFRIMPEESNENIEEIQKAKRTDGLWMIITNIPGKEEDINGFTEGDLISAYRDKNQIEQAFKDVKSFIKIQPFNVWKPKHVRAHYTICVLSYLLDITITNRLGEADIDINSPQKVYEILRDGIIGRINIGNKDEKFLKLEKMQSKQERILNLFQSEGIAERKYLDSIGIK